MPDRLFTHGRWTSEKAKHELEIRLKAKNMRLLIWTYYLPDFYVLVCEHIKPFLFSLSFYFIENV